MTIEAKEKHKQEKGSTNKYYRPTRHISWIEIIPKYISPREAAALSTEEKEKLLKPFERPKFPLPDLPPVARIRLFRQDLLGAESIVGWEGAQCHGGRTFPIDVTPHLIINREFINRYLTRGKPTINFTVLSPRIRGEEN